MEAHLAKNTFSEKNTNRERLLRQLCLGLRLAEAKKLVLNVIPSRNGVLEHTLPYKYANTLNCSAIRAETGQFAEDKWNKLPLFVKEEWQSHHSPAPGCI